MTETNSSFSKTLPTFQFAWDSTSLGLFKECPRKYYYSMLLAKAPREVSVHLTFGIAYHKALEMYDHARAAGADHHEATRAAVRSALSVTWIDGKAWFSDDPYKNRFTLVRSVVWYLEHFEVDPCKTVILANGKPAVELSFRFETEWNFGVEPILLSGHLDRLVEFNDSIYVLDRKTTKSALDDRFTKGWNPNSQMTQYTFAAQVIYRTPARGVIIDGAQILVGATRFNRSLTMRTPAQLTEWYYNTGFYIRLAFESAARAYDRPDSAEQFYPMNDKACGNYGGCDFRQICSKDPKVRRQWLDSIFKSRVWDPLQVRGDPV